MYKNVSTSIIVWQKYHSERSEASGFLKMTATRFPPFILRSKATEGSPGYPGQFVKRV